MSIPPFITKTFLNLDFILNKRHMSDFQNQGSEIPLNHIEFNIFQEIFIIQLCKKLCEFEALSRPENQCKCHEGSPLNE